MSATTALFLWNIIIVAEICQTVMGLAKAYNFLGSCSSTNSLQLLQWNPRYTSVMGYSGCYIKFSFVKIHYTYRLKRTEVQTWNKYFKVGKGVTLFFPGKKKHSYILCRKKNHWIEARWEFGPIRHFDCGCINFDWHR